MRPETLLERHHETWINGGLAALSAAFVAACAGFLQTRYMVNDDVGIILDARGGYAVRYVGILLTSLLHWGYAAVPDLPWLGLALYGLHALALFAWLKLLWRATLPRWLAWLLTPVVLGYYLVFLLHLDYTAASVMLSLAGVTWACVMVLERQTGLVRYLLPGLLFMLGMIVRPQGAPGALAYGLPLALVAAVACLRDQSWKPEARRLVLVALVFFAPAALNYAVDAAWRQATLTPQEAQYDAFNAVRGKLHRLSRARMQRIMGDPALLASVNWTRQDAYAFFNWKFLDERVYTPESMQKLLDGAPPPRLEPANLAGLASRRLPPQNLIFPLLAASLPFFVLLLCRRRYREGAIGMLTPLYSIGLTVFMYVFYAFTYRVEMPFETGLGFGSVLLGMSLAWSVEQRSSRWFVLAAVISAAVALTGMGAYVSRVLEHQPVMAEETGLVRQRLDVLNAEYSGSVILAEPTTFNLGLLSPLDPMELRFEIIGLGWNTFSPRFYEAIGKLGTQHGYELMGALVDHPNAFIYGSQDWCEEMLRDSGVSPSRHVEVVRVRSFSADMGLYRLATAAPAKTH